MFSKLSKFTLARAVLTHDVPVYVQFYVTARCNLTCQQCNIIYANSDVRECTLDEIKRIADNFARLKVAIILLTGGEPFARQDLPEIIQAFTERGIHVRMQTNGHASQEQIHKAIEYGGNDISSHSIPCGRTRRTISTAALESRGTKPSEPSRRLPPTFRRPEALPRWGASCSAPTYATSPRSFGSAPRSAGSPPLCPST